MALALALSTKETSTPPKAAVETLRTHARTPNSALCFAGLLYVPSLVQRFVDAQSWRQSNGGRWATEYAWGRTNRGAGDAAYHLDETQHLGKPVFDPFSITGRHTLAIEGLPVKDVPNLRRSQVDGMRYVSGVMSTAGPNHTAFRQQWGYYEVAARLPRGRGLWPAFWMLDSWGGRDEVDAFEFLGNDRTTVYQSVHYAKGGGSSYPYHPPFDPTRGFHRYGVLLTPLIDTFYVDGIPTHSVPNAAADSMYFMLSLSIGGRHSWPGPPDRTTPWPAYLEVDNFKAYAPTTESC